MNRTLVWLCRIDGAGAPQLTASRACAPVDAYGVTWAHRGGLSDLTITEGVELGSSEFVGTAEATITTLMDVAPASLLRDGWRPDALRCELALWRPGQPYEGREIIFKGTVVLEAVGADGEPVTLTVLPPPLDAGAVFPPTDARVLDTVTWANPSGNALGESYPWVFGAPGVYVDSDGVSTLTSGSPAYVVDTTGAAQKALISAGRVVATQVRIYSAPEESSALFAVTQEADARGRICSVCDVSAQDGVWTLDDSAELYVTDWQDGGVAAERGLGPLTRAGDVLLYLLRRQGVVLDQMQIGSVVPRLNRVKLDGYWREGTVPMEWLGQEWAPLMPDVWLLPGPRGVRIVALDEAPPALATSLTIGQDLYRPDGGTPEYLGDAVDGLVRAHVQYARRVRTDAFRGAVATTRDRRRGETPDAGESPLAKRSASRGGVGEEALEAAALYSRTEVYAVGNDLIRARWAPPVSDVYTCDLADRARYPIGRALRVTDERVGYSALPVWVTGRIWTLARLAVTVAHRR